MSDTATPEMAHAGPAFIPTLEDHETLYSLCSTVHALNRTRSGAWTATVLMGAAHAIRQHDWPRSLRQLSVLAPSLVVDPSSVLKLHTVAGFYLPFLAPTKQSLIASSWGAPDQTNGPRALGAISRTLSIDHPLKWCDECVASDIANVGRACWHTVHQYPTTYRCPWHFRPLQWIPGHGKRWLQPACLQSQQAIPSRHEAALQTLADIGAALHGASAIDPDRLRQSIVDRWIEMGVVHSRARISETRLHRWFQSTAIARALPDLPNGLAAMSDGEWIRGQIWRHKRSHAVRWVVLWSALGWSSSAEAVERFRRAPEGAGPRKIEPPSMFVEALRRRLSYQALMCELQVPRGDIVRWFEAHPELRKQWRQRRFSSRPGVELTGV